MGVIKKILGWFFVYAIVVIFSFCFGSLFEPDPLKALITAVITPIIMAGIIAMGILAIKLITD
jgi:hypothetical protein